MNNISKKYINNTEKTFRPEVTYLDGGNISFTIKCTMRERWISYFLSMLKYMQQLGEVGSSREVAIYSDGDGDFNPKFEWEKSLDSDESPVRDKDGDVLFDAG